MLNIPLDIIAFHLLRLLSSSSMMGRPEFIPGKVEQRSLLSPSSLMPRSPGRFLRVNGIFDASLRSGHVIELNETKLFQIL